MIFLNKSYLNCKKLNKIVHIFFIVSVIFILHHKTHILDIFDKLAFSITSLVESSGYKEKLKTLNNGTLPILSLKSKDNKAKVDLLLITKKDYTILFGGISPLDRCYLSSILKDKILSNRNIRKIVFDIDLSPICQGSKTPFKDKFIKCQRELDNVLSEFIKKGGEVVIIPPKIFQDIDTKFCYNVRTWENKLKSLGVKFLSPKIISTFGIALYYPTNSLGAFCLKKEEEETSEIDKSEHENLLINYKDFVLQKHTSKSDVIFIGGTYDPRDYLITPVGNLPGVIVHALGYLSFLKPIDMHSWISKLLAFSFDLITAIIVSIIFSKLWHIFLKSQFNYEKFIIFATSIFIVFIFFFIFSLIIGIIYKKFNILISIIPILISLFFDSFNGSLVETLEEIEPQKEECLFQPIIHLFSGNISISNLLESIYQFLRLMTIVYSITIIFS